MKTHLSLLCLAAALLAAACKKDDPDNGLPPATQEGKNTAGCFVNGEPFVAAGWGGSLLTNPVAPLGGGFFYDSLYYLRIHGLYKGSNSTMTLFFRSQISGVYRFNQDTPSLSQGGMGTTTFNHATFSTANGTDTYITNKQNTGQVALTSADRSSGISAGTFEFTAASTTDPSKTVTVTSGRFDRKQ